MKKYLLIFIGIIGSLILLGNLKEWTESQFEKEQRENKIANKKLCIEARQILRSENTDWRFEFPSCDESTQFGKAGVDSTVTIMFSKKIANKFGGEDKYSGTVIFKHVQDDIYIVSYSYGSVD
jgi:hypothetical protein